MHFKDSLSEIDGIRPTDSKLAVNKVVFVTTDIYHLQVQRTKNVNIVVFFYRLHQGYSSQYVIEFDVMAFYGFYIFVRWQVYPTLSI